MTGKKMEVNLTLLLAGLCIVLAGGMGGGFTYFLAGQWENKADIQETEKDQEKEYILYIGLNDKDEYRQIISTEEAQEIINAICNDFINSAYDFYEKANTPCRAARRYKCYCSCSNAEQKKRDIAQPRHF